MKKLLLTLTAFVAVLGASAQSLFEGGWAASYEPVSKAEELKGVYTAVAEDGSVFVSGTYNKAFTFAGKNVADPEDLTSASIVKYNEKGEEQWIVTMEGNAIVSAIDVDADGTLYAAGYFIDAVKYEGAEGISAELSGSADAYAAFVAKISKDGKFETVKVIASTANEEIVNSFMYFPMAGDVYVKPSNIQIDGDKVYVAANYAGDVAELSWKGAYINVFDVMYMDNRNVGVFSLNKSDLSGAVNVATVQNAEIVSYVDYYAKAFDFVVDNGTVYVGFIGVGNMTLATSAEKKDFTFAKTDEGALEHAFVLAAIGETTTTKVYNVAMSDKLYTPYNLFMDADGENLIIGGTFSGELPFDTQKTSGELASDVFMASVKKADGAVNWTYVSGKESVATYTVTATNVVIATGSDVTFLDRATGEVLKTDAVVTLAADGCATARAAVATAETKVVVSGELIAGETPDQVVDPDLIEIAQDQGKQYDTFARAELVEGEEYNTYTVTEDLQIAFKMMDVDVKDCDYVVVKFAEPVAAGWKLAFWSNQDLVDVPEGATEFKYVFADDPKCGVVDGVLPQICMMTFFGGYTAPLEAKVVGIYKHIAGVADAIEEVEVAAPAARKYMENGKLVIIKDGKKFGVNGVAVK